MVLTAALALAAAAAPAQPRFVPHHVAAPATLAGGVVDGGEVVAWGDGVWRVPLRGGRARRLGSGAFGPGGCLTSLGPVLQRNGTPGDLVLVRGGDAARMDTGAALYDCMEATLHGRRGVLVVHGGMQVRFYSPPDWRYREIYSFYTPSAQGGLALVDVNGDGRVDILCGNYWIRNPESFDLPWRLFAINTYSERERSGMSRLAWSALGLVVSQREMDPGRLTWFARPEKVEELWIEHVIDGSLRSPAALVVADFDGDGWQDVVAGENAGTASRLLYFKNEGRSFRRSQLAAGEALLSAGAADVNQDGRIDVVTIGTRSIVWWENRRQ